MVSFLLLASISSEIIPLREALDFRFMGAPSNQGKTCGINIEELLIPSKSQGGLDWFPALSALLQRSLDHGSVTVLVSGARPFHLNPVVDSGWESTVAMLILAFPEARWLFGTIRGYAEAGDNARDDLERFRLAHGIGKLFHPQEDPLFDGRGLRDWVRARASDEPAADTRYLSRRKENQVAYALDDESRYCYLHAYTAYRFGFRATPINSARLANFLLGQDTGFSRHEDLANPLLVFEDIYVNFAGGTLGMSWLSDNPEDGKGRATQWPRLQKAAHRIFVTSGQRMPGDDVRWIRNKTYVSSQKALGKNIHTLYKPYAGIFRLWESSGLMRSLRWSEPMSGRTHRGTAEGFVWPPPKESLAASEHGHSSPGVLLTIAEKLIERAERLLPEVRSVQHAVLGAVWATDALEILGGRTPTISIEAVQLKHHFEVLAECQFTGVEDHIQLTNRFAEIERDVNIASRWFGPHQQEIAGLNAELKIVTDLVRVFREFSQFDEEQLCLQRMRTLQRRLWFKRRKPWSAPIYPFRWYVEFLLGSISRFAGAITLWIALLAVLYLLTGNASLSEALKAAFVSFVAIQPHNPDPNFAVTVLAMLSGATHLGIFISHLYSLVSRR